MLVGLGVGDLDVLVQRVLPAVEHAALPRGLEMGYKGRLKDEE